MRALTVLVLASAVTGCSAFTRPATPGRVFGTAELALNCAQDALERTGFQVQGDDVGARSYERLVPGRRDSSVLGRQRSTATNELAYVRVVTVLADSTPTYRLRASGFTTSLDGTDKTSTLHEQGVGSVVGRCGATR